MCGIAGFTGKKNRKRLTDLLALIKHRGRDGTSVYGDGFVNIGMNRLAILDLSHNPYPMKYRQHILVFNGEIYNYRELKRTLSSEGIRFKTQCDAEVILPLYTLYGTASFAMLEGMFAVCIYDSGRNELVLARDKSGEKPLYYSDGPDGLAFASEMKVLFCTGSARRELDTGSLRQYLTDGFVSSPGTLVRDIHKIPPSSCMVYDVRHKKTTLTTYWKPPVGDVRSNVGGAGNDPVSLLDGLIRSSVAKRLVADVPVGTFLSGGIDSSLVTLFASTHKKHLRTYSVSFPGYESLDESPHASYVAGYLHTEHTVIPCTSPEVRELLLHLAEYVDEPIVDPAVLPTILMAREARKRIKVVLTGEGADELFGGYARYRRQLFAETVRSLVFRSEMTRRLAAAVFPRRFGAAGLSFADRYSPQHVWNRREVFRLLNIRGEREAAPEIRAQHGISDPLLAMQLTDYRGYMAEQLLMKIDKSTMSQNLEARAPYLDSGIIRFAFGLSRGQKVHFTGGKVLLKQVAGRYFPKPFVWRKKHGFDVPLRDWFRRDLKEFVFRSLDDLSGYGDIIDLGYYRTIITEHMSGDTDHANKIWSMVVLAGWMKTHEVAI